MPVLKVVRNSSIEEVTQVPVLAAASTISEIGFMSLELFCPNMPLSDVAVENINVCHNHGVVDDPCH